MKLLIENVNTLTMNDENMFRENISVGVEENRIVFVGEKPKDFVADKTIDGKGKLLMPGLVNAHTHMPMTLFRNYADDLPFHEWLFERVMPIEEQLDSESVYWGTLLALIESIKSGVTCFNDMYFFLEDMIKACSKVGIRSVLGRGLSGDKDSDTSKEDEVREIYKKYNNAENGRITFFVAPHAPYTCDDEYLKRSKKLADELNVGLHIHLSESKREVDESIEQFGMTPIKRVAELGLLDGHVVAAHCVHVTEEDLDIMKEKNVHVLHNPGSNMKLANGFAPVKEMLDRGINVALGTDGAASNNNLNMFEEINYAGLLHKATHQDPLAVSTIEALKMATINGAKALNLKDVGMIKEGYKADMILLDIEKPHFYPRNRLISSLVYSAQASDVETVICDGRILMENHKISFADEMEVLIETEKQLKRLVSQM